MAFIIVRTKKYFSALLVALLCCSTAQQINCMQPNQQQEYANQYLRNALREGNKQNVSQALEYGANIESRDEDSDTPLIAACRYDNTDVIKLLIEKGAQVNVQDFFSRTPLIQACENNNTEIIKLLLTKNARVNVENTFCYTPLIFACCNNNTEIIKLLLEKGAQFNIQDAVCRTPLIRACEQNNTEVINTLIAYGAEITPVTTQWYGPHINQVPQDYWTLGRFYTNQPTKPSFKDIKRLARQYGYPKILADVAKLEMGRIAWQDLQKSERKQDIEFEFND